MPPGARSPACPCARSTSSGSTPRARAAGQPQDRGGEVPGYNRAPVSAELTVVPSAAGREPPQAQIEAAVRAAGESGLARESGPGRTLLAGGRAEGVGPAVEGVGAAPGGRAPVVAGQG